VTVENKIGLAALLPELQPAPCFPVCHYWTNLINSGVSDYCCHDYWGQAHLN